MKNQFQLLLLAFIVIICQSCTRIVYTPNMQNAPLIKEKKEIRSTIGKNDLQVAYGVTNGLGVMVNAHWGTDDNSYEINNVVQNDDESKRHMFEFGLGHFRNIDEHGVFEIYGGGGLGKISFDSPGQSNRGIYSSKFSRVFVQPSIGFAIENVEAAFSLRFTHLNYYDSEATPTVSEKLKNLDQHSYSFIEPAITFRVGFKQAKLVFQGQRIAQVNSAIIDYEDYVFSFGLHFNIAKRHKVTGSGIRDI